MGIFVGWNVLQNDQELIGIVRSHDRNGGLFGDGDWILMIEPQPSHQILLTNSHGRRNADGLVECEIEPTDSIDTDEMERHFFGPLAADPAGNPITVTIHGPWVEDLAHDAKTEIHPIKSILIDRGMFGPVKHIEFFVFSDDSANFPHRVPQSGNDQEGRFTVPYPPPPAAALVVPQFAETQLELTPTHGLKLIQPVQQGGSFFLDGRIGSGIAPVGGFYHAIILMWFDSTDIELRGFQPALQKRFARVNGNWSILYDVDAEAVLSHQSRPGLAIQNVTWRLQRRDQPDLVSNNNPVGFHNVELTHGANGNIDYHPQLSADIVVNVQGGAPLPIRRVLDLQRPHVAMEIVDPPRVGQLAANAGGLKKIVWDVRCRTQTANFINPNALTYQWTIEPLLAMPTNPARALGGRNVSEIQFDLEYALPNKNAYVYKVSVAVTDQHGIEQAAAAREINIPRPNALILLVAPLQEVRARAPGQNAIYRFVGHAALSNLYGNMAYHWTMANTNGWAISNQGPINQATFTFDFEYNFPLGAPEFPPAGPVVEIIVTDEAGQTAVDSVDVSLFVPGVAGGFRRAFDQLRHLLDDMRALNPKGVTPRGPIFEGIIETIDTEMRLREKSLQIEGLGRVSPGMDEKQFVKGVERIMNDVSREWKGRDAKNGVKTAIRETVGTIINGMERRLLDGRGGPK